MRYGIKAATPSNPCLECGVQVRQPKRFCSETHKELWLEGRGIVIDSRGVAQVADGRRYKAVTAEALEWRNKLNVSRSFS
jgi:hypothetical protein